MLLKDLTSLFSYSPSFDYIPFSIGTMIYIFVSDKCHWYVIIELISASSLCDLIAKLMQNNITSR